MITGPPIPGRWRVAGLMACLFAVFVLPVVLSGRGGPAMSGAQRNYHEPVIRAMVEQWPNVDIQNYNSATAPGYHLSMAFVARYLSDDRVVMQFVSSLFGLAFLLFVQTFCMRHAGAWKGLALTAPLLTSSYVLANSIWLTTDNAALAWVSLAVGLSTMVTPTPRRLIGAGVACAAAVFTRQIHIWTAGPLGLALLFACPLGPKLPAFVRDGQEGSLSWGRTALASLGLVVPLAMGLWLYWLWGGPMPAELRHKHQLGQNPALFAFALALVGGLGLFFVPAFIRTWRQLLPRDAVMWSAAIGAAVVSCAMPTSFLSEADANAAGASHRWGGMIWEVARAFPSIGDRSVLFPPFAALAGIILVLGWRAIRDAGRPRQATALVLTLLGWMLVQSFNAMPWQRYCEPVILVILAYMAALAVSPLVSDRTSHAMPRWWMAPIVLSAILFTLCVPRVYLRVYNWTPPVNGPAQVEAAAAVAFGSVDASPSTRP